MEFGIFDHVDRGDVPLRQFYEERLQLTEVYDRLGFYCYHVAEHHCTPLGVASSPGILLSAAAQRTRTLRLCPMVYLLPFYHPLRIAEEICMLDQMSGGRLDVGVGRGVSPVEARYYGLEPDPAVSREVFEESLSIVLAALTQKKVTFQGKHRSVDDVPIQLEPLQKPHPPLWMGVETPVNAQTAGRKGFNFLSRLSPLETRERVELYRAAAAEAQKPVHPNTKMGGIFFIVVADTDAAAQDIADAAFKSWHRSFHYLYKLHGRAPVFGEQPAEFSYMQGVNRAIAGTPDTVADFLGKAIKDAGINYVVGHFAFGDMKHADALRSVELFATQVMPRLRA